MMSQIGINGIVIIDIKSIKTPYRERYTFNLGLKVALYRSLFELDIEESGISEILSH